MALKNPETFATEKFTGLRAYSCQPERAALACLREEISGMVTCPLNKEAIHTAGFVEDLGHQEILARLANVDWTATMLMTPGLKVAHLSTHKSLIEAARYVTKDNISSKIALIHNTLGAWGMLDPKIAVAALNLMVVKVVCLEGKKLKRLGRRLWSPEMKAIMTGPIPPIPSSIEALMENLMWF